MDLKQIRVNTANWIDLAQGMDDWNALMNAGSVPRGYISHAYSVYSKLVV